MARPGWLWMVVAGGVIFVGGIVLQVAGLWHLGLAVSMFGVIVGVCGSLLRPRRPARDEFDR